MHVLSKSTYVRSLQCQKSLYLYKNFYKDRDPTPINRQLIFNRGHKVGELAHQLFPGGIDVSPPSHFKWAQAAKQTSELISKGQKIIYEAAFIFEGILVAVDLLVHSKNGWKAYEVKSNLEVKEVHIRDASLQYYVITGCGIELNDFSVVHINRNFVKNGPIDVHQFFSITSVHGQCIKEQKAVKDNLLKAKQTLSLKEIPKINVGIHCYRPYDCDFYGTCWKNIRKPNVFNLENVDLETQLDWFKKGVVTFDDVMHHHKTTKLQRTQILSISKNEPLIETKSLSNYFASFTYPIHFIDFKFIQSAIPTFDGGSPFKKTAFAYSLLIKDNFDTAIRPKHFMAEHGFNPFPHLLSHLIENVQAIGDIFICNKDAVLKLLQSHFDESIHSSKKFDSIIERSREYNEPFYKAMYYHPALRSTDDVAEKHKTIIATPNSELSIYETEETSSSDYENLVYETDILKTAETRQNVEQYS
ncbi:MAG: DUF2779 domain-containing protein, partial [Bacteroidia bacterium]|nr:DUF2779 domain-containing protein [Bacteroidia bacterium]NNM16660.1 DUF2779 domain-containing protein [Bacteroidia bacterium]